MNDVKFSKKEAIKFGWKKATGNIGYFIGLIFIIVGVNLLPQLITPLFGDVKIFIFIITLAAIALQLEVKTGTIKSMIKFVDGDKPVYGDLFSCFDIRILKMFGMQLLSGLIVLAGFILFIVPGIILGIKFMFAGYLIAEKNMGVIESLKKSAVITQGSKMNLFLYGILVAIVNVAGALCLGVGLLVTFPLTMVATAYVYRKLEGPNSPDTVAVQFGPPDAVNKVIGNQ